MCVCESCYMNVLIEQSGGRRPTNTCVCMHTHTYTPVHTPSCIPLTGRKRMVGSTGRIHRETLAPSYEGLSTSEGEECVTFLQALILNPNFYFQYILRF